MLLPRPSCDCPPHFLLAVAAFLAAGRSGGWVNTFVANSTRQHTLLCLSMCEVLTATDSLCLTRPARLAGPHVTSRLANTLVSPSRPPVSSRVPACKHANTEPTRPQPARLPNHQCTLTSPTLAWLLVQQGRDPPAMGIHVHMALPATTPRPAQVSHPASPLTSGPTSTYAYSCAYTRPCTRPCTCNSTYVTLRLALPGVGPAPPASGPASPRGPAMSRNASHPTTAPRPPQVPPAPPASPTICPTICVGDGLMAPPPSSVSSRVEHRPPMKREQSLVGRISFWLRAVNLPSRSRLMSARLAGPLQSCVVMS